MHRSGRRSRRNDRISFAAGHGARANCAGVLHYKHVNEEPDPQKRPRTALIGALTIVVLAASFILAIMARAKPDVAFVVVAPAGTSVILSDHEARNLPNRPSTSEGLASHYFMIQPGEHEVRFKQPGRAEAAQLVTVPPSRMPVIYTLLNDTLREMKSRNP